MLLLMLLLLLLLLSLMPLRSPQLPIRCVEPSANMRRSILCCVLLQFSALLTTVCVIQLTILGCTCTGRRKRARPPSCR